MKVVNAHEMKRLEEATYARGTSEESCMNQAGRGVAFAAMQCIAKLHLRPEIALFAGKGNNGGDAFVAARLLHEGGFHVVVFATAPIEKSSPLNQLQRRRFEEQRGKVFESPPEKIDLTPFDLLIDGLLGTGFQGALSGPLVAWVDKINASGKPVLGIDLPSGLDATEGALGPVVRCHQTLCLGLPKSGCFLDESWNSVGKLSTFDFGLGKKAQEEASAEFEFIDRVSIKSLLPPLIRTRHKYAAGYVIGVGGSPGMPGAPLLAARAAFRAGAGLVRLFHPQEMSAEFGHAPLELIREAYEMPMDWQERMQKARALFIGPGMRPDEEGRQLLEALLRALDKPAVIDAGALALLSQNSTRLPPQCILTPHRGEMERLLHLEERLSTRALLAKTQEFVEAKGVTLVLKGAPTFILSPGRIPFISAEGDPGMATAGTGDALTGILAALLAQGKSPLEAALLGVTLHGRAGELAAERLSSYAMMAGDLIEALPEVFKELASSDLSK